MRSRYSPNATPKYCQYLEDQGRVEAGLTRLTFHASYSYEDFIEGLVFFGWCAAVH